MGGTDRRALEERVLVLAPTARDAALSRTVLTEAGVACALCPDLAGLCRAVEAGAGAAVLTEEALAGEEANRFVEALGRQPPWSDLPLLLLTGGGADSPVALGALEALGNVTLLERPVRVTTLVSAVRAALRARRRQYQIREHLVEQERVAEALREASVRKDEFLAMLAHELRNPLAPLRNALHILRRKCGSDPVVAQLGGMMERQIGHLVRLVDDLLDVSRITRGKFELRKETVDLAAAVARAVESVRPSLDERQHHFEVVLPPEPLRLEADPDRVEQVLTNLLSNAVKYTEPGGRIVLAAERQGDEAVVRVRDNGIGIRPEMLGRIFEMFTQGDRVAGRLAEGLGLGLTLVRRLVEMHGGTVEARSAGPGQGSEFTVRLPALSQRPPVSPGITPTGGRGLRVLVVDDHTQAAESLALFLRLGGHEVRVAGNGPSALETARVFLPEAVVLDIGLPGGMDGYTVARRLRQQPGLEGALLIAVTGHGQGDDLVRAGAAGFDHHLTKPADPRAIERLLASLITPTVP